MPLSVLKSPESKFFMHTGGVLQVDEVKTKWKGIVIMVFAVVIAAFFIAAGLSKVMRPEDHSESFCSLGLSSLVC